MTLDSRLPAALLACCFIACVDNGVRSPAGGFAAQPAQPPPPPALVTAAPPPPLATPKRVSALASTSAPAGWVNFNGLVLPAIPGLTVPVSSAPVSAAPSQPAASPASPASPAGWVTILGIAVPAIPGFTVPNAGQAASAPLALTGRCGAATVAGHRVPLDCITPNYGEIPWASQLVLSRGLLSSGKGFAGAAALPDTVDHRADGTEGPVRDQQEVGACTGFSLAAAIDHAAARLASGVAPVSAMHVWSRYHDPLISEAASDNRGHALTKEADWPYDEKVACSWDCQDSCHDALHVACAAPDPVQVSAADSQASVTLANATRLDINDLDSFKDALAKGQDVWFGMQVDADSFSNVSGSNAVVPDGTFRNGSGHAMILAGYRVQSNGTYYLIHNSWGTSWGDRGYAWIHETTLKNNITSAYLVDVTVTNVKNQPPAQPVPPQPTCPAGSKPDSTTGACAPACSDGSPRNANACPVANQCPPGYVNLIGRCVIAAPIVTGQDAKTGVFYTCSAGGCTYAIPFGQAGCSLPYCAKSCPAPKFQITVSASGAGCSE